MTGYHISHAERSEASLAGDPEYPTKDSSLRSE